MTYLEENKTTQINDDDFIAEVLNKHFTGLAESLSDKTDVEFNPATLISFVSIHKTLNAMPGHTVDTSRKNKAGLRPDHYI